MPGAWQQVGIAAEQRSDLMVLGVNGRDAADRLFFGSTVSACAATCPVLTLRT
jgi:nucleotide-binding universal stress UspA family protein